MIYSHKSYIAKRTTVLLGKQRYPMICVTPKLEALLSEPKSGKIVRSIFYSYATENQILIFNTVIPRDIHLCLQRYEELFSPEENFFKPYMINFAYNSTIFTALTFTKTHTYQFPPLRYTTKMNGEKVRMTFGKEHAMHNSFMREKFMKRMLRCDEIKINT